jgi:ribosome-binding factor A
MKPKKQGLFAALSPREIKGLADDVRPGDGIHPREEAKQRRRERRKERAGRGHGVHKQEQFYSQVRMAIESALQTAASPILNRLVVQEIVPQGGSLVVVLTPLESADALDVTEATPAVEAAATMLRRELAAEISRKDTPNLAFVVLPAGAQKVDE